MTRSTAPTIVRGVWSSRDRSFSQLCFTEFRAPGFGRVLEAWFSLQCEREPSRGFPGVAVCARCLGIYVGLGLGALVGRPRLPLGWLQLWIALAALALLADTLTEAHALRPASASLRFFTGALLAYPIALVIGFALAPAPGNEPHVPSA